jgi:DNA-binding beta-propeller fold protein YncE
VSARSSFTIVMLVVLTTTSLAQTGHPPPATATNIAFVGMFQSEADIDLARTPCQIVRDLFDHSGRASDVRAERPAFCDKIVDVIAGKAAPSPEAFNIGLRAAKLATDSHRRILLTEPRTRTVHIFDFVNRKYTHIDGSNDDRLLFPFGVAVDVDDNIYVTDIKRGVIAVFDRDEKFKHYIGDYKGEHAFEQPNSIAIDAASGRIYLADTTRQFVLIFDRNGKKLASIGKRGGGTGPAQFRLPTDVALHGRELFVLDKRNARIQVLDLDGHYKREFATQGLSSASRGMAIDSQGLIYVPLDIGVIEIFNPQGDFVMRFGTYGSAPGEFIEPQGIFIDSADRLYITDTGNRRVQVFQITRQARNVTAANAP